MKFQFHTAYQEKGFSLFFSENRLPKRRAGTLQEGCTKSFFGIQEENFTALIDIEIYKIYKIKMEFIDWYFNQSAFKLGSFKYDTRGLCWESGPRPPNNGPDLICFLSVCCDGWKFVHAQLSALMDCIVSSKTKWKRNTNSCKETMDLR